LRGKKSARNGRRRSCIRVKEAGEIFREAKASPARRHPSARSGSPAQAQPRRVPCRPAVITRATPPSGRRRAAGHTRACRPFVSSGRAGAGRTRPASPSASVAGFHFRRQLKEAGWSKAPSRPGRSCPRDVICEPPQAAPLAVAVTPDDGSGTAGFACILRLRLGTRGAAGAVAGAAFCRTSVVSADTDLATSAPNTESWRTAATAGAARPPAASTSAPLPSPRDSHGKNLLRDGDA
jgi:hypothetical protein